ncbi:MAG TPA: hypothetical protein VM840_11170 [Actinomycetota bacterium]|nr:hypothetical protein [Actinomycetota bacterium]
MRRLLAVVAALAALGCGTPDGEVTGAGLRPAATSSASEAAPSGAAPAPVADREPVRDLIGQDALEPFPGQRAPTTYPTNTMRLDVAVVPRCGTPGTRMRAVIETEPNVIIGIATEYASYAEPDMPGAPAYSDPRGRYEWTWILRPETPRGPAFLKVAAGRSGVGEAAAEVPFMVAEAC